MQAARADAAHSGGSCALICGPMVTIFDRHKVPEHGGICSNYLILLKSLVGRTLSYPEGGIFESTIKNRHLLGSDPSATIKISHRSLRRAAFFSTKHA